MDRVKAGKLAANIVGVISDKADAYGLQRAARQQIPTTTVVANPEESRQAYDHRLQAAIEPYQANWIIMAGFMRILSDALVEKYLGKLINIHPSLLPKFKGLNTHQRALDAGETSHGASVHFVTPSLDDGPVIMQRQIFVNPSETADELKQRVHQVEHLIYPDVVQLLCQRRVMYSDGSVLLDGQTITSPLNP
jgi:phosphoribosylglycinamide formyltransferase-1